ncbi:ferritin [Corynebacterium sp. MSK008]|uniref:ferritin n=1 Tax=Corynebacterium sp. MSK008 TaxID=3050188 RepID=UPI00255169C3|nr:ferritin [Corynebacterium sp. MSK008]MDK8880444.1 ferritin [Corynebacterium sp. MSK008]
MIDERLFEAINQQVTEEYAAAYIYRHLANEMDALSFPGLCEWFTAQAAEECEHAQKFAQHLIDRGARVVPHTIEIDAPAITGPLDAFEAALEHEKKVSEQIRTITRLADEVGDLESRPLLNWFLNEQIEEEATVGEIVDQLELVGADGSGLLRIDARLAGRPTPTPEAQ